MNEKELHRIGKLDARQNRNIRKKEWSSDKRYCDECFYEIFDYEDEYEHQCKNLGTSSYLIHKDTGEYRRTHPNMMKILKDRKKNK